MLSVAAYLTVDETGISCHRPLGKTVTMKWDAIACSGSFSRAVYSKQVDFLYFSSKSAPKELRNAQRVPPLTDSFVYAAAYPGLAKIMKKHHLSLTGTAADKENKNAENANAAANDRSCVCVYSCIFLSFPGQSSARAASARLDRFMYDIGRTCLYILQRKINSDQKQLCTYSVQSCLKLKGL